MFCETCGAEIPNDALICSQCQNDPRVRPLEREPYVHEVYVPMQEVGKSRILAGILQLLFGFLGIGRMYLGYTTVGILQMILTFSSGGVLIIWPFIDSILIFSGIIKTDANGIPLRR